MLQIVGDFWMLNFDNFFGKNNIWISEKNVDF
mgnify:CR=1 FL=1